MVVTYYGVSCFKVQVGDTVFVFDPPAKSSKFKSPRFQANVVLVSHNHEDHNGFENISAKKEGGEPLLVFGPGEYEASGISISGVKTFHDNESGKKRGVNTVYVLTIEDITVCHMGDFGEEALRPDVKEKIGDVNILFMPIGGDSVLNPRSAAKIAYQLEPEVVVPMHYSQDESGEKLLREFIKEFGNGTVKPEEKLTLKKKDITQKEESEVFVLKPCLS